MKSLSGIFWPLSRGLAINQWLANTLFLKLHHLEQYWLSYWHILISKRAGRFIHVKIKAIV